MWKRLFCQNLAKGKLAESGFVKAPAFCLALFGSGYAGLSISEKTNLHKSGLWKRPIAMIGTEVEEFITKRCTSDKNPARWEPRAIFW